MWPIRRSFLRCGFVLLFVYILFLIYIQLEKIPKTSQLSLVWSMRVSNPTRSNHSIPDGEKQTAPPKARSSSIKDTVYVINKETKCADSQMLTLLVLVLSNAKGGTRRAAIRKTWGRGLALNANDSRVICLFLVGPTTDTFLQQSIESEDFNHNDIIQNKYILTSSNISLSHDVSIIHHWVTNYCSNTRYVLTVDDTTFVILDNVQRYLNTVSMVDFAGRKVDNNYRQVNENQNSSISESDNSHLDKCQPVLLSIDVIRRVSVLLQREGFQPYTSVNSYFRMLDENQHISTIDIDQFDINGSRRTHCGLQDTLLSCNVEPRLMYALGRRLGDVVVENTTSQNTKSAENFDSRLGRNETYDNFPFITFPTNAGNPCGDHEAIFLLLITVSIHENGEVRQTIRNTRGRIMKITGKKIIQMFFIENLYDNRLLRENDKYHDIILSNVNRGDKRSNKTPTFLKFLKWTSTHCQNVKFIAKVDDDVFVNLRHLVKMLLDSPRNCYFTGYILDVTKTPINERNNILTISKQNLSERFPPVPSGFAYIMTSDVAKELLSSAQPERVFLPEEVYMGMQLSYLGISILHHGGFDMSGSTQGICGLKKIIVSNKVMSNMMFAKWQDLEEWGNFKRCSQNNIELKHNKLEGIGVEDGQVYGLESTTTKENGTGPFLINHPNRCKTINTTDDVFVLVGVLSHPKNEELRRAIRETWGSSNTDSESGLRIETIFFIGLSDSGEGQKSVEKENFEYGDIIQINFVESYQHLVLKTLSILKWASEYCTTAKYLIKVDDEVFLNYHNFIEFLQYSPRKNLYMGNPRLSSGPMRSKLQKWYTPSEIWPSSSFPPFANGGSYVLSIDLVSRIIEKTKEIPIFKWEDVYIGVILQQLGIMLYPHIHFDIDVEGKYRHPCIFPSALASHGFTAEMNRFFWKMLQNSSSLGKCNGRTLEKVRPNFYTSSIGENPSSQTTSNKTMDVIHAPLQYFSIEKTNPPFLIIFLMTLPKEYEYRKYFRLLLSRSDVLRNQIMVRFVVGTSREFKDDLSTVVSHENELYRDILHQTFIDTPQNNARKLLSALHWATTSRLPGTFVMFLEATVVHVNIENVLRHLHSAPQTNYVFCYKKSGSKAVRSQAEYYPSHCDKRAATIMSFDVAEKVVEFSQKRPIVKSYDIYFGILLHDLNITIQHGDNFNVRGLNKRLYDVQDCCTNTTSLTWNGLGPSTFPSMLKLLLSDFPERCKTG
ncbi:uncharacterized protein LOC144434202 [Glandiceps talaboti]